MAYWFVFHKDSLLLTKAEDGSFSVPCQKSAPDCVPHGAHIMDVAETLDGKEVKTVSIDAPVADDSALEMCNLRKSFYKLSPQFYKVAGKCQELVFWDRNTRFCGSCGAPMAMDSLISKRCTNCGKTVWPQLATAIIVLINRGDDLLLVHSRNFKTDFYGCVAGFVETGESLEEAVRREVKEETQIEITHLRYFKSQPWPYPCGLMVGFFAEYKSGELALQDEELSRGGWFNKNSLPTIPEKLSLARMLIDHWLEEHP